MESRAFTEIAASESKYWWYVLRRRLVKQLVRRYWGMQRVPRWLDIGCGCGVNVQHWCRLANHVVGLDVSPEALAFARTRAPQAEFIQGDAAALPFEDNQFDIVTALDVIEHLDDDLRALREMNRVLRPGGLAIVTVPAYMWLYSAFDRVVMHRRRYTRRMLVQRARTAGFHILKSSYFFSGLLPVVALYRFIEPLLLRLRKKDVHQHVQVIPRVPAWINRLAIAVFSTELFVVRWIHLPFGTSVFIVGQKPA